MRVNIGWPHRKCRIFNKVISSSKCQKIVRIVNLTPVNIPDRVFKSGNKNKLFAWGQYCYLGLIRRHYQYDHSVTYTVTESTYPVEFLWSRLPSVFEFLPLLHVASQLRSHRPFVSLSVLLSHCHTRPNNGQCKCIDYDWGDCWFRICRRCHATIRSDRTSTGAYYMSVNSMCKDSLNSGKYRIRPIT